MRRALFVALAFAFASQQAQATSIAFPVVIGSKADTETTLIAEIINLMLRQRGITPEMKTRLGGSPLVWEALQQGSINAYVEYTGTLTAQLLADRKIMDDAELRRVLSEMGIEMSAPLGFANNYAIGMRRQRAEELGIKTISDLRKHPGLVLGFSNEFMNRADGWPGLRSRYGLPQKDVRGMDHRIAYESLVAGSIDATELYTTDAEIKRFDLVAITDDLGFFPVYQAVILSRFGPRTHGEKVFRQVIKLLEGSFSEAAVIEMNGRVQNREPLQLIAADFIGKAFGTRPHVNVETDASRLWRLTQQHLLLVGVSLTTAILIGLPLGIVAARRPRLGQVLIGGAGVVQTIPALALLVFMIPLFGTGYEPAIVALFLYSLLPIINNTAVGLRSIPASITESAEGLGLSSGYRLWKIELPLASRSILTGIRTSAVINIGTATLGALIGAGGYGQPIQTGLQLVDHREILFGAIPAAVMALLAQGLFTLLERVVVPRGLRL